MTSQMTKLSRARFKAMREGKPFDPPDKHADLIVALLKPAAQSDPAPDSLAYTKWVRDSFSERFMELCRAHPVRARRP